MADSHTITAPGLQSLPKRGHLRMQANKPNIPRPIRDKINRLRLITDHLAQFRTTDAKVRILLGYANQRDLVEFAILYAFESLEELAQGLHSVFSVSTSHLANGENHPANTLDNPSKGCLPAYSPTHRAADSEYNETSSTTTTTHSTLQSGSTSNQGDDPEDVTDPTELDSQLSDELVRGEKREPIRDKEYEGDDNNVFDCGRDAPRAANIEPGGVLYHIGGASATAGGSAGGPFDGHVDESDDCSGSEHGSAITIRQNYAPLWEETPRSPSTNGDINPSFEESKLHCITEGCPGQASSQLNVHRGSNRFIGRWTRGSVIKYSIDYRSFTTKGRSMEDAKFALDSLQLALWAWDCHSIGVKFQFVEANTSPVVFKLKYKRRPSYMPHSIRDSALSMAFFPVDVMVDQPQKLYIFSSAFDMSFRQDMMRVFLHEVAHILGGRHEHAAMIEHGNPSVRLGSPNDLSVLVTNRDPSAIRLHWKDIKWFDRFMRYPEGYEINGFPIRNISP